MAVRKGVVCVIYTRDGNNVLFLVLHRIFLWKGWEFVKGGVEKEDITEEITVRREIEEETGLKKIRIGEKLPYVIKYSLSKKYGDTFNSTEQHVFLVHALENDVKLANFNGVREHDDFKWLPYEKARKILTHVQQRKALDLALKKLKDNKGIVTA